MHARLLAPGVTANYLDYKVVLEALADYVRRGLPITLFMPLRIVRTEKLNDILVGLPNSYMDENELIAGVLNKNILQDDLDKNLNRVNNFISKLKLKNVYKPRLRIVLHTDYSLPLWCNKMFQDAYLGAVRSFLVTSKEIFSENSNITLDNVTVEIEVHPGFTTLNQCRPKGLAIHCQHVERDVDKLGACLTSFENKLRNIARTALSQQIELIIEPRKGSIVVFRGRRLPQTLATHHDALIFAKRYNLKIVLDPAQTILKDEHKEWQDVFDVACEDPCRVAEIHVHMASAHGGRGHGPLQPAEMELFNALTTLVRVKCSDNKPLGLVLEFIRASANVIRETLDVFVERGASIG